MVARRGRRGRSRRQGDRRRDVFAHESGIHVAGLLGRSRDLSRSRSGAVRSARPHRHRQALGRQVARPRARRTRRRPGGRNRAPCSSRWCADAPTQSETRAVERRTGAPPRRRRRRGAVSAHARRRTEREESRQMILLARRTADRRDGHPRRAEAPVLGRGLLRHARRRLRRGGAAGRPAAHPQAHGRISRRRRTRRLARCGRRGARQGDARSAPTPISNARPRSRSACSRC